MSTEKTQPPGLRVHAIVMRLFADQALTISKSGDQVTIGCESGDDAESVFEWLANITGQYESVDGWLDEIELFGSRRERLDNPRVMESWLKAAFDAGRGV